MHGLVSSSCSCYVVLAAPSAPADVIKLHDHLLRNVVSTELIAACIAAMMHVI